MRQAAATTQVQQERKSPGRLVLHSAHTAHGCRRLGLWCADPRSANGVRHGQLCPQRARSSACVCGKSGRVREEFRHPTDMQREHSGQQRRCAGGRWAWGVGQQQAGGGRYLLRSQARTVRCRCGARSKSGVCQLCPAVVRTCNHCNVMGFLDTGQALRQAAGASTRVRSRHTRVRAKRALESTTQDHDTTVLAAAVECVYARQTFAPGPSGDTL